MAIFPAILAIIFSLTGLVQQQREVELVEKLFRLRNEHKADSAELLFADTVLVYMKTMRNVAKEKITVVDRQFWKVHPRNRFDITAPVQVKVVNGVSIATIYGNEYLDGKTFKKERIEIRFDRDKKINYFRGFNVK